MLSELARGKCNWDGTLKLQEIQGSRLQRAGIKSSISRQLQIRPSTSFSTKSRAHTASRSLPIENSVLEDNQLLLPKTYLTRKGDLVLFAVFDDELFALVDSSLNTSTESLFTEKLQDGNVELLSQFHTLEDFVLSVLDYKHEQEKFLYASAHKKLFAKHRLPTTKDKVTIEAKETEIIEKNTASEIPQIQLDNVEGNCDNSRPTSVAVDEFRSGNTDANVKHSTQEYGDSSLVAAPKAATTGKLRSPLIERKEIQLRDSYDAPKEYIDLHTTLQQRQGSAKDSTRLTFNNYTHNLNPNLAKVFREKQVRDTMHTKSNLEDTGLGASSSTGLVPNSVLYVLKNIEQTQTTNKGIKLQSKRQDKSSPVAGDSIVSNNTLLPFMFDETATRRKSLSEAVDSRRGSMVPSHERLRSASLKDLANINLHPRISSSKPAPDVRALGVTPSAVKISQKDFQRILDVTKNKLNNNSKHSITYSGSKDLYMTAAGRRSPGDSEVFWQEGSFLSIEEAEKRLGLTSNFSNGFHDDLEQLSQWARERNSICSTKSEDADDSEDKILFSYIRSSYRKGSWNPKMSVSYNDGEGHVSKGGLDYNNNVKRASAPSTRNENEVGRIDDRLTSSRAKSFRENVRNSESLNFEKTQKASHVGNASSDAAQLNNDNLTSKQNIKRSISYDVSENRLTATDSLSNNKLLRAVSLDGSRPVSRASSTEKLDEVLSVRSFSPLLRLLTPESDFEREKHYSLAFEGPAQRPDEEASNQRMRSTDSLRNSASGNLNAKSNNIENGNIGDEQSALKISTSQTSPANQRTVSHDSANQQAMSSNSTKYPSASENAKQSINETKSPNQDFNRESTFASNTATNISIINSIPDQNIVNLTDNGNETQLEGLISSENVSAASGHLLHGPLFSQDQTERKDSTEVNTATAEYRVQNKNELEEKRGSKKTANNGVMSEEYDTKSPTDTNGGVAVDLGLRNQTEARKTTDPIKSRTQLSNNDSMFIESDVFGSRQLLSDKTNSIHGDVNKGEKMQGLSYEEHLVFGGIKDPGIGVQYHKTEVVDKRIARRSKDNPEVLIDQAEDLKVDLHIAKSKDTTGHNSKKPAVSTHFQREKTSLADQNSLRLEGIGGEEQRGEDSLQEVKMLIERNKNNSDISKPRKPAERSSARKKGTSRPGKKSAQLTRKENAGRRSSSTAQTQQLSLPKRTVTTETLTAEPIESGDLSPLEKDDSEEYKIIRDDTLELEEEEQPQVPINVKVQNVEVKKVSDMEPEKRGAYPPSKTKKGKKIKKILKKSSNESKRSEDRMKYEEQMRFLKEKEIEQQRARETAMAKQKALEEEKMRYQEEEENAKKKEEEARTRLAEAKQKAKEEREAKRLADAEKRRQLVEQRREERRQKEVEIAKKEKDAERLKYEKERRAIELREQRERLKEQERLEEERILEEEREEALQREEEEKRLEEERVRKAQEELERLIEEREYREQLRRVAEAQQAKMRELEEQRLQEEQKEKQRIAEERDRLKRAEYLKLQAELERQKEAQRIADGQRKMAAQKASKRKAELIKRREQNLERMFDLKSKREFQGISRSFTFTYFVHIPRSVWELPIGWNKRDKRSASSRSNRPTSTSTAARSAK